MVKEIWLGSVGFSVSDEPDASARSPSSKV